MLLHKILLSGLLSLPLKNFTAMPVSKAENIVPSLVPTMVKSKNKRERIRERITQKISKAIFIFPNSLWAVSEIAFTKASPEFIMTFAITERDIPKPRMMTPMSTMARRRG